MTKPEHEIDDFGRHEATATRVLAHEGPSDSARQSIVVIDEGVSTVYRLPVAGSIIVGRSEDASLRVNRPWVSRRHAMIHVGPQVMIEDLGSSNGTLVHGQRLESRARVVIEAGAVIEIGATTLLLQRPRAALRAQSHQGTPEFDRALVEECARAVRGNVPFCLVRIEVAGGLTEDDCHSIFASCTRPVDVFTTREPSAYELLLPGATFTEAQVALRRIEEHVIARRGSIKSSISAFPRDGRTPDALLRMARSSMKSTAAGETVGIVVRNAAMQDLHSFVERIAVGRINVLIHGETGVGKEVIAEAIHRRSTRSAQPFLRLNCAALSESLLESELFGFERGAFTGAVQPKAGLLEAADTGTVFLDEIGEMPMSVQVKLLRVLEDRLVRRIGALKSKPIDVRFVSATNRNLEAEIAAKAFRHDLYFRLNGVTVTIPPLRERIDEIEGLARAFIAQASKLNERHEPVLSSEALDRLQSYPWPGNIRELRNVVERAVLLCVGGTLHADHFPLAREKAAPNSSPTLDVHLNVPASSPSLPAEGVMTIRPPTETPIAAKIDLRDQLAELERSRILQMLEQCGGNQSRTAKGLGMSRRTLIKRLDEYGVARPRKGRDEDETE